MSTKVLHLSDLHLDVNEKILERGLLTDLVGFLNSKDYDLLFISGDIGGSTSFVLWVLDELKLRTGRKVLFVPGNHDVWSSFEDSFDTLDIYKSHSSNLLGNPYKVGDWAIVGGFSWYDYSYRPDFVSQDDAKYMKKRLWNDHRYTRFGLSDVEVCDKMLKELSDDLLSVSGKKIWLMNHFVPYQDYVTYKQDWTWNMCSSYLGSSKLGDLIDSTEGIEVVSFGHTHNRFNEVRNGIEIVCNPLGYCGPVEWKTGDFLNELELISFEYYLD